MGFNFSILRCSQLGIIRKRIQTNLATDQRYENIVFLELFYILVTSYELFKKPHDFNSCLFGKSSKIGKFLNKNPLCMCVKTIFFRLKIYENSPERKALFRRVGDDGFFILYFFSQICVIPKVVIIQKKNEQNQAIDHM